MLSFLFSPWQLFCVTLVLLFLVRKCAIVGRSLDAPCWRSELAGAFLILVGAVTFLSVAPWPSAVTREQLLQEHPDVEVPEDWKGVRYNRGNPVESPHGIVSDHPVLFAALTSLWVYSGIEAGLTLTSLQKRAENSKEVKHRVAEGTET